MVVAGTVVVTSVAASIAPEDMGMIVVEVSYAIVAIDGKIPSAANPGYGVQEVVGGCEEGPLPVEEDVAQVSVAIGEVAAVDDVILRGEAEQIVEVDFVAVIVLLIVEVEFISHLVREEAGFFASSFVAHSLCSKCAAGENQGEDKLFNIAQNFRSYTPLFVFDGAKVRPFREVSKRKSLKCGGIFPILFRGFAARGVHRSILVHRAASRRGWYLL